MSDSRPVLLTRHGQSEHNLNTQYYMGRSPDSRLTDLGRDQARQLGGYLAKRGGVDRIVASSLPRTRETAEIVAARMGVAEIQSEDAFWELSKGDWEGTMPRNAVPPPFLARMSADPVGFQFPGGESFRMVADRTLPAFHRWVAASTQSGVLFVLHGDVICALLHRLLGFPADHIRDYLVRPCSLTTLVRVGAEYRMTGFNEIPGG